MTIKSIATRALTPTHLKNTAYLFDVWAETKYSPQLKIKTIDNNIDFKLLWKAEDAMIIIVKVQRTYIIDKNSNIDCFLQILFFRILLQGANNIHVYDYRLKYRTTTASQPEWRQYKEAPNYSTCIWRCFYTMFKDHIDRWRAKTSIWF